MIGFSQSNELNHEFISNRTMPTNWSEQQNTLSIPTDNVYDEFDAMMKQEHEDVILLDHSLPVPSLDLDLDSLSDLLENPSSSTSTSYTQPLSIAETSSTSAYSSLGISPKFTTLSIHPIPNYSFPFNPQFPLSTGVHHQADQSLLGTSYPFPMTTNSSSDVKRFRSASMNEGNSSNISKLDPLRFRPITYVHRLPNEKSPTETYLVTTRPASNSFSASSTITTPAAPPPFRLRNHLSSSFDESSTLFSLNQFINQESSTRKRPSLVDFPVEEIKDDPISPNPTTFEHQSETDLWSDIEQNSSDPMPENDFTSDEEQTRHSSTDATQSTSSSLFWQYNVQSKGPKTKRILYLKERDPHLQREFSDPVYQIKLTQSKGQNNLNKLRKGDGNDVTPNPMKLYLLGRQIRELSNNSSSVYHGIYHVESHSNSNDSAEVKKEKNKIASRACRLRKKAQHEANKLKLHGLNEEHKALIEMISSIKALILQRVRNYPLKSSPNSLSLEASLDQLITLKNTKSVAGNTDGFVQGIINDMEHLYQLKQQQRAQK